MRRRSEYQGIRPLDIILCILVLGSNIFFLQPTNKPELVKIVTPEKVFLKPIDQEWTMKVKGLIGPLVVVNKKGTVRVEETHCPKKICLKSRITKEGGFITCLPNQVFICLEGNYDAISK